MVSEYVGIETARKTLGDLVDHVQTGTDILITRNGRAIARLTAHTPEDTMTSLNLHHTTARIIARARANTGLSAAEFDYDIAKWHDRSVDGIGGLNSPLGAACYEIATEHMTGATADQCDTAATELWNTLKPELVRYAQRCRDRKYAGWSNAARARGQRITYAD